MPSIFLLALTRAGLDCLELCSKGRRMLGGYGAMGGLRLRDATWPSGVFVGEGMVVASRLNRFRLREQREKAHSFCSQGERFCSQGV